MLSGFIYDISGMPSPIRLITYLIPARYFVQALQTLFQAGYVRAVLLADFGCFSPCPPPCSSASRP